MANLTNVLQELREERKQAESQIHKLDSAILVLQDVDGRNGSTPARAGARQGAPMQRDSAWLMLSERAGRENGKLVRPGAAIDNAGRNRPGEPCHRLPGAGLRRRRRLAGPSSERSTRRKPPKTLQEDTPILRSGSL